MTEIAIPATGTAAVRVRHEGHAGLGGDAVVVIDPGMVSDRGTTAAPVIIPRHGAVFRSETDA